jgi:hypothetical protein
LEFAAMLSSWAGLGTDKDAAEFLSIEEEFFPF